MRFSQRIGKTPIRNTLQVEDIDESLKSRLWNTIYFRTLARYKNPLNEKQAEKFFIWLNHHFFKTPADDIPHTANRCIDILRAWYFFNAPWYKIYDLIEFLVSLPDDFIPESLCSNINDILESEMAAYRIVNGMVCQITDNNEIEAIHAASSQVDSPFSAASRHIKRSVELCFDRKSPDYRNAIKEAISAIESAVLFITSGKAKTLGSALKLLTPDHKIHPALQQAFNSLYGYTSDEDGIRHAMLEDNQNVTFDEAKYMVVCCSAFLNYLISKHRA